MGEFEELGGYRLERLLGRGTMGSVFLARPCSGGDRPVAIKRVPALGTGQDRARLRREAETMVSLDHPNIVPVTAIVDDGDGVALVMPYAEGGTLAGRLADGRRMDPDEVRAVIAAVADALAAAHRQGVLHRDVKPSNILFTADGVPLLADFGIAHNASQTNLTSTDMAMGTAGYLDPDLADGVEPSPAGDQYALGVVAYEALTGGPPFTASSPLAVLRAADRGDHERLDATVHGPLANVVERAFARNRNDRFPDLGAFAGALRDPDTAPPAPERTTTGPGERTAGSVDATRAFRRRANATAMAGATPVIPTNARRRFAILAGVLCALGVVGGAVALNANHASPLRTLGPHTLPDCDARTTSQCVRSAVRTARGIQITFENDARGMYTIGQAGDALLVGNWFCGSRATLAVYRPRSGVIYYFNNWPDPDGAPTTALVDSTQVTGAQVAAGDRNNDGCADLALDVDGTRTWFLPHIQPRRLRLAPGDPNRSAGALT